MTTNIEYCNWFEFPGIYIKGYGITLIVGCVLVGLGAAAFVKGASVARS